MNPVYRLPVTLTSSQPSYSLHGPANLHQSILKASKRLHTSLASARLTVVDNVRPRPPKSLLFLRKRRFCKQNETFVYRLDSINRNNHTDLLLIISLPTFLLRHAMLAPYTGCNGIVSVVSWVFYQNGGIYHHANNAT